MTSTQPPRVLYVLKRYPQTSQTFVVNEIRELEAGGTVVGIDALAPDQSTARHDEVDLVRAAVRYVPRRGHSHAGDLALLGTHLRLMARNPYRYVRTAWTAHRQGRWRRFVQAGPVAQRARRERFDVIHAHFATAAAEVAGDAAALANLPYTVTAHAKDIFQDGHAAALARRVERASAVITVSAYNERHLSRLGIKPAVHLVRNGVPVSWPAPRPATGPILCVARLVDKKGVDTLLAAVALALPRCPGLTVEIVGQGEAEPSLRQLAEELGLTDRVQFLGTLTSNLVDAAYRRCSMFVLPCRISADGDRDGMPTVIVEALARALPVVTTDIIGMSEVVSDDESGLLVPPEDPSRLAGAIGRLWHDPALAARLGRAGRAVVAQRFDPAVSAARLRDVFETLSAGAR